MKILQWTIYKYFFYIFISLIHIKFLVGVSNLDFVEIERYSNIDLGGVDEKIYIHFVYILVWTAQKFKFFKTELSLKNCTKKNIYSKW